MTERERKDEDLTDDEPDWGPPPPGFMDRPEVKAAIAETLKRQRERTHGRPGVTVDEVFDEFERRRLASGD